MISKYTLYSNHNTDTHIFVRVTSDGKQSVVSSEEMKIYDRGKRFPEVMDVHHALVRFMFEVVNENEKPSSNEDESRMESVMDVPFDRASEIILDEAQ